MEERGEERGAGAWKGGGRRGEGMGCVEDDEMKCISPLSSSSKICCAFIYLSFALYKHTYITYIWYMIYDRDIYVCVYQLFFSISVYLFLCNPLCHWRRESNIWAWISVIPVEECLVYVQCMYNVCTMYTISNAAASTVARSVYVCVCASTMWASQLNCLFDVCAFFKAIDGLCVCVFVYPRSMYMYSVLQMQMYVYTMWASLFD